MGILKYFRTPFLLRTMPFKKVRRNIIFTIVALISIFAGYYTLQIKFNYDFDQFFPKGSESTEFYHSFQEEFGSENDYLLVAIKSNHTIFDVNFLAKVDSTTHQFERLAHVNKVTSLTNMTYPVRKLFVFNVDLLRYHNDSLFPHDTNRVLQSDFLKQKYYFERP